MKNYLSRTNKSASIRNIVLFGVILFTAGILFGVFVVSRHGIMFRKILKMARNTLSHTNFSKGLDAKIIGNFESEKDLAIWERKIPFNRSQEHASEGKYSLKVIFPKGEHPAISSIFRSQPEDWSQFSSLAFDIYNPQYEVVKFWMIIKDKDGVSYHKRHDRIFYLEPGLNNLKVDLKQLNRNDKSGYIKTDNIIQYVFFLIKPHSETIIYFDNIRLEKKIEETNKRENLLAVIDAEKISKEINPLLFGSNLAPKTTYTKEIEEFINDIGLTIFRFPGGDAPGYHWKSGFFDFWTDKPYMFPLSKYDRVVNLCKDTNSQLVIQINLESGTPEEAAEWVKYTNKELGFYVRYWELGNEAYGSWDKSYRSAWEYARNLKEYSEAMKAIDPTIKIGADWGGEYFGNWDEIVMRDAGEYIDFVSYHWYPSRTKSKKKPGASLASVSLDVAANAFSIPRIVNRMKLIIERECPQKKGKIEFSFLEWEGAQDAPTYDPEPYEQGIIQWSLANALFYAETYKQFIEQGVNLSANFKFQECPYGLIRGHYTETERDNVVWDGNTIRPKALVVKLFRKYFGSNMISSELRNSPTYFKSYNWDAGSYNGEVPYLSCLASKNESGNKLYIMLINRHPSEDLTVYFEVKDFDFRNSANVWKLTGPEITSQNDGSPGNVDIAHEGIELSGPNFKYISPAHSVVSIELDKAAIEREDEDI